MSEKRQIAFLCHPYHRGGVTRWMADAAIAMAAGGMEVYFVTVSPAKEFHSGKGRETMLQLLAPHCNKLHIIKASADHTFEFGTGEYRGFVYKQLIAQLPAGTPIILSNDADVWAAGAAMSAAYPTIGVQHGDEAHYYDLAKQYSRHIAFFACVSKRIHDNLCTHIPDYDPARINIIPCGINIPEFRPTESADGKLQLIYVGRIDDYPKRTTDLVKIGAMLAARNIDFHLSVIGDGDAKPAFEKGLAANGLQQSVTFHGWQPQAEVMRHLFASDILLLTSDFEGMPIAMMEALAAGCGMAGTRVSGIEDYEYHPLAHQCFRVFGIGDIADAVDKISQLSTIPKATRRLAARELAETAFSMKVCINRYLKAVDAVSFLAAGVAKVSLPFSSLLYSRAIALARYIKVSLR